MIPQLNTYWALAAVAVSIVVGGAVGYGSVRSTLTMQCNAPFDAAARHEATRKFFDVPEVHGTGKGF